MPTFLLSYWRYFAVLFLCLACYAGGRYGTPTSTDKTVETQDTEKTDTKTHDTDKVTVITKKPDGTTTTTITDHSKTTENQTESKVAKQTETKSKTGGDAYRPNYRAGAQAHAKFGEWTPSYSVEAGYRVLGNAWGTASYNVNEHQLGLGVSIDF